VGVRLAPLLLVADEVCSIDRFILRRPFRERLLDADQPRSHARAMGSRIAKRYARCMAQFVTRVEDNLAREVDLLVREGVVASRSAAVRLGLEDLIERHRRRRIGQAIVDGYRRRPQTEDEVGWADEATRQMIADEPW